ncbi:hypothetical protein Poly51_42150 [Rubripirellula tenax]|uniref:Glycine zipper domain-containing protein n=2 Tax=Rubripirellula tenax TaxID=2528015 RepID=A0A5C6EPB3_9BACT|nr:hypothetical protein Poly51_42150 [Rubripirellula tenax]
MALLRVTSLAYQKARKTPILFRFSGLAIASPISSQFCCQRLPQTPFAGLFDPMDRQPMEHLLMSRTILLFATIACAVTLPQTAHAQAGTQRGATLGGLGGAVAGAIIGDHNGEAGAGAAIGGVIGAVTGGLLGNANDKQRAAQQQQQYYYQQQQQTYATQSSVSIQDVISMSRSGLSEGVIINQINQRGTQVTLQVPDIIALHQQGVSENVISALQRAPSGSQRIARAPEPVYVAPSPVIVEERYIVPSYPPPSYHYYRHAPPRHYHHGSSIRIGF